MVVDSLDKLKTAFGGWRLKKRYLREPVPEKLMERARRAAAVHGVGPVAKAINFARLGESVGTVAKRVVPPARKSKRPGAAYSRRQAGTRVASATSPCYSMLTLPPPEAVLRPLVEVETPAGVKLRVFAITPETVSLLSSLSGTGRGL